MKIQQTITARLLPSAFTPLKHGLILGAAILFPSTGAFSAEIASWTFATDSGKPATAGAPVVSAESTPANEWPLKLAPKDMAPSLVYKKSVYENAAQYPLMVEFTNVKPELRGYLHNAEFNGLVGKKSWRIDMELSLESRAPVILMDLGGAKPGGIRIMKNLDGILRISQRGRYDLKVKALVLEPKKPYKISLIKDGKVLSMEINGQRHVVARSGAVEITSPGICIGGPGYESYMSPAGSISAIRISTAE